MASTSPRYQYGQTKEERIQVIEANFYREVNSVIANRVTPFYNAFLLVSAAVFAYFVVLE